LGIEKSNLKHAGFAAPIQKQSLLLLFFIFFFPRRAGFRAEVSGTQLDKETKKFFRGRQRRSKKIRSASARATAPPRIFFLPAQEKYLFKGNARIDIYQVF
jgi:hypothetical protein